MNRQPTDTQFFYQNRNLITVKQGGLHRAIFRNTELPLAELTSGERNETGLLVVDPSNSILKVMGGADEEETHCYSAYGHSQSLPSHRSSSGFNGEPVEAVTAKYLLGNGYRLFSPVLMRFYSTDTFSPFDRGGLNAYSYCAGDPVNHSDPTGHIGVRLLIARRTRPPLELQRSQLLATLDSPSQVNVPYRRDAPPYPSSSPQAFSTAGSPPPYNPGRLPTYSRQLPDGHHRLITSTLSSTGELQTPAKPPSYKLEPTAKQVPTSLPPEQVAAYSNRLREINSSRSRLQRVIRQLESRNMHVPASHRETLANLNQRRDRIRDLLSN